MPNSALPRFRYGNVPTFKTVDDVQRYLQRLVDNIAQAINSSGHTVQALSQTGGGTQTIDASKGQCVEIKVGDATAFTIANPLNLDPARDFVLNVFNNTGGAIGAITFGSNFKLAGAFTNPGAGKRRTITFYINMTTPALYEKARAAADI